MADEEGSVRDELERLAQAHLAADSAQFATAQNPSQPAASLADDLGITRALAADLLKTRAATVDDGAGREHIALVSVPGGNLPADMLFRLDPPVETAAKLEEALGLEHGSLQAVAGDRTGDEGEKVAPAVFVFVTAEVKERIHRWVRDGEVQISPLFVKLNQTT